MPSQKSLRILACLLLPTLIQSRKAIGGSGGVLGEGGPEPTRERTINLAEIDNGQWQLPPLDTSSVISKLGPQLRTEAQYICDTLGKKPLSVILKPNRVGRKQGVRTTGPQDAKFRALVQSKSYLRPNQTSLTSRMRSVWSMNASSRTTVPDPLKSSYEDCVSATNPGHFELEVYLPKTKSCSKGNPCIVYSIPMGPGSSDPKSRVSQANGVVTIYPRGKKSDEGEGIEIGQTSFHLLAGANVVDKGWAKGRQYFWKGRSAGVL